MRRVVYTRRMILSQTKRYIIQNGFRNVTARNLAAYMEMSTQPLYKQFDSIQGLQQELVEEYFHKLAKSMPVKSVTKRLPYRILSSFLWREAKRNTLGLPSFF